MKIRSFKEKLGRSLNANKVRENNDRILLTINDLPSDNVTYHFEPFIPFFYKCPRYRVCRCYKTQRTKYITSKTMVVGETFSKGTPVVMEEGNSLVSFFWLFDCPKDKSYIKYDYEIRSGRKCSFEDGVFCSCNKRVTQMRYLKKTNNKLHALEMLKTKTV